MIQSNSMDALTKVKLGLSKYDISSKVILSEELLKHNYNELEKHYFIHDVQNYSDSFSERENIYILGHEVTADFPLHNHDFFELTYVCRGELINNIDGNELYMCQGDITIINDKALQSLKCIDKETLIVNFCIKKTLFERTLKEFSADHNPISDFLRYENPNSQNYMFFSEGYNLDIPIFINHIISEYTNAGFHQTFALEAWLILLFDTLAKSRHISYLGIDGKTLEILLYIQKHCMDKTLAQMAAELGYNPNYLTGYIKRHTGKNYREIMMEIKMKKALRLLAETSLSVYEIAAECGYSSPSYFFQLFKESFHISPKKYRDQVLGGYKLNI